MRYEVCIQSGVTIDSSLTQLVPEALARGVIAEVLDEHSKRLAQCIESGGARDGQFSTLHRVDIQGKQVSIALCSLRTSEHGRFSMWQVFACDPAHVQDVGG